MNSPRDRLVFNDDYEIIEYLGKLISRSAAWSDTSTRLDDAHKYVQNYCMPNGWGKNVWHSVLDDAIRMRKEQEK